MERVNRRTALKAGLAIGGTVLASGCLGDDGTTELRLAHVVPEAFPIHAYAVEVVDIIEDRTDGSVTIEIFPEAQLGDAAEIDASVSDGSIDMGSTSWGSVGGQYEPMSLFEWPYLFETREHSIEGTDPTRSDVMAELNEGLVDAADKRIMGASHYGLRSLNADREVTHPDDLSGLSVRAQPTTMFVTMFEAWGADPQSIAFPEIPQALTTGEIQGWDNTSFAVAALNSWEFTSHWIDTRHLIQTTPFHINEGVWQDLSDDEQEIFRDAFSEANDNILDDTIAMEEGAVEQFRENGMTIIDHDQVDTEAFRTRADDAISDQFPDLTDELERVRDMA